MAFAVLNKEDYPSERGQKATEPRVSIAANGQVTLNSYIVENYLGDNDKVGILADGKKLAFVFCAEGSIPSILGKGYNVSKAWNVNRANIKDEAGKVIGKAPTASISLGAMFSKNDIDIKEGTKLVGTAKWNDEKKYLSFDLEKLEERKVVEREKKEDPPAKPAKVETIKVDVPTADSEDEDDI